MDQDHRMSANSKIEWTDHTFNPWWGCTKVSAACAHCYAEAGAHRRGFDVWGAAAGRRFFGKQHWDEPRKWNAQAEAARQPAFVFCASYADVCEILPVGHPDSGRMDDERLRLARLIYLTPWLTWLLLTKRPENLNLIFFREYWPPNAWAGTTAEHQQAADARIPILLEEGQYAGRRFVSYEPALGPVDFSRLFRNDYSRLDWIICGGESGPHARPMDAAWALAARDQAEAARVAFFFKQWGEWMPSPMPGDRPARLGKFQTGRLLDNREWNGRPGAAIPATPGDSKHDWIG
jgi:protein gp37